MIESRVKFYGDAWKRNECNPGGGVTNGLFIGMGLHQCSALSHFLFTLVIDGLMRGIQEELPWEYAFCR